MFSVIDNKLVNDLGKKLSSCVQVRVLFEN